MVEITGLEADVACAVELDGVIEREGRGGAPGSLPGQSLWASWSRGTCKSGCAHCSICPRRANGSGWQLGIGRLGAIAGPFLGALFVGLPVEQLYIWSALPFAAGAVVTFLIYVLNQRRLRAHPELQKAQ